MYFYALTEELSPAAPTVIFRDFGPYLELGDTVVRDIGQPAITRVRSSDFSLDFGPGTFGDNILEFGTTVYRDSAPADGIDFNSEFSPIDFGVRNSGGVEWFTTTIANSIFFIDESSATVIVTGGPSVGIEWIRAINPPNWTIPMEWRGSPTRDMSSPIEWRAQPVVNWVNNVEWGLSTRSNSAAPIDFNMTRQASSGMPAEWKAALFRDNLYPVEPDATTVLGWSAPIEWRSPTIFTTSTPVEWRMLTLRDHASPVEIPGSALGTVISPIDFSQPAQMSVDFAVPLEFVNRIFAFYDEPTTTNVSRTRDATFPAEWAGNAGVTLDASAPLEWRGVFTADATAPIEWRRALTQDTSSATEWGSTFSVAPVATVEFGNVVLGESFIVPDADAGTRTEDVPTSLEINAAPFLDIVVPVAISGSATGTTGDATAPLSFGGGFGSPSYPVSLEFSITSQSDALTPSDWLSAMLSEPETVAESTLSVVGESFIVPDTNFDLITEEYATPLEWSATGISAVMTVQVERTAEIFVDAEFPMNWFGTSLSADTLSLIDWTQDTASVVGDASVPIDWTYHVLVDVIIETEERFGRKSIGSSLEPDEWEEERD